MDRDGMTRPYIFDTPHERRLHFTHEATQSAMSLDEPDALIAAYTRKMMAFLLMNPEPRHILMIGLGGGSLAKFCYRHLPSTRITVVELSADVIAMRSEFLIPDDDARFRVVHGDGARYVQEMSEPFDVLLIDAFDEDGIATTLADSGFYASAARLLTEHGVMVMNLWGKPDRYVANLEEATAAFGRHALLVTVPGEANVLMFASRRAPPKAITGDLESIANHLQLALQLDFPRYLRRICQGQVLAAD
jgi:spermidine synthase